MRFLESLDPTRFVVTNHDLNEIELFGINRTQSMLECAISFLFGNSVALTEPQSFDSLGFLNIAHTAISSWRRNRVGSANLMLPFILALRENRHSYAHMVGSLYGEVKFKLSSLQPGSPIPESQRVKLGMLISNRKWKDAGIMFGSLALDRSVLDAIVGLDEYFESFSSLTNAVKPPFSLEQYVSKFEEIAEQWSANISGSDPVAAKVCTNIKDSISYLHKNGYSFKSRSPLHEGQDHLVELLGNTQYGLVREFVDTSYNIVVAGASGATDAVLTTQQLSSTDDHALLEYANGMACCVDVELTGTDSLTYDNVDLKANLLDDPSHKRVRRIDWDDIWNLILFDGNWSTSMAKLRKSTEIAELTRSPSSISKANEDFVRHTELVANKLGYEYGTTKGSQYIKIIVSTLAGTIIEYVLSPKFTMISSLVTLARSSVASEIDQRAKMLSMGRTSERRKGRK